ncbi:hypothetical protein AUJ26_02245 [Candidatus Falkowbacteria bacterium CG1_02_37_21]|nr:MAG: hypothetical protein AUJ26_02245 [Candidatus Falkowbacteria bacterium CG1_02_37_21]
MPKLTSSNKNNFKNFKNKNMKKELVFPLIVGVVVGVLVMTFWQFNARLSNVSNAMTQLEAATNQNTKTVGDIVAFINNATGQNAAGGTETPAAAQ